MTDKRREFLNKLRQLSETRYCLNYDGKNIKRFKNLVQACELYRDSQLGMSMKEVFIMLRQLKKENLIGMRPWNGGSAYYLRG